MRSRQHITGGELAPGKSVVNLSEARRQTQGRVAFSRAEAERELAETNALLDRGLMSEAEARLQKIIDTSTKDANLLARARCLLSMSLAMRGRYRESLEELEAYEAADVRLPLEAETTVRLRVQHSIAYSFNGDHPKAIAILNTVLRETTESGIDALMGLTYSAMARVYRSLNEFPIARDHAQNALKCYRNTGDWRGLAEAYHGIGMADTHEGDYESGLGNFEQALKLIGDHPAPFFLGRTYSDMAGACWFLRRPLDGIRYLEKAITYYEHTEHKATASNAYNNLGINLMLVGEWERAHEALKRALMLSLQVDERSANIPMIYDSLGELRTLRGDFEEAQKHLERAVKIATENGNKWYAGQALRSLARCHVLMGEVERGRVEGEGALALAERIGDRQGVWDSSLILAEAHLRGEDVEECAALLHKVADNTSDSATDLPMAGEAQRLFGMLALAQDDPTLASHHFGRSLSIYEMVGDRYRCARAHFGLGIASTGGQPERAVEHLTRAAQTFRDLGAHADLARTETALNQLNHAATEQRNEPSALSQLLTLRLAEAVASRELLLRELAAVILQETNAARVLITEEGEDRHLRVVIAHGCAGSESTTLAGALEEVTTDAAREQFAATQDAVLIQLRPANAPPATLIISPQSQSELPGGVSIEPLLKVVELGMDVCALRARSRTGRDPRPEDSLAGASLMPGFIHSSPAMTRLVDEVHKIRSSDVTVLVTGESGTGKELVARAIHALSSRRSKVFVPFNCTAVPKELSEGYLFGYRRGAFTGAVSDSPGVIRSAEGGTLFLDEIGDLPLDVQPKILRFLQEGEIQPLGERRPVQVDVRIIAATNSDLETMVGDGRFREDLYYRLNVIRLRVPPLGERRSEIPTIVNYYINHYAAKFGRRDIQITPQTVDLLMVCDWPGNVRQLCNEIQRIVARAEDGTLITPDHLSPEHRRISANVTPPISSVTHFGQGAAVDTHSLTLADAMAELERRMVADALRKHNGNISRAARELGLTRRGLYLKLERYAISATA